MHKKSVDRKDTVDFLSQHVVPGSKLWSDGAAIYKGINNHWRVDHSYERHNKWEFALTSEIEGLWGNLFTFIRRMYHHITQNKVEGVINEFVARFCFKEWFESPANYLGIALQPVTIPISKRSRKKSIKFLQINMPIFELNTKEKSNMLVPSCL